MHENSRKDIDRFLSLDQRKKRHVTHFKPNGEWDDVADIMMINFSESVHPVFCGSSAFGKRRFEVQKKRNIFHTFQWQRRNRR